MRITAGECELTESLRIGAVRRSFSGRDQFVRRSNRIGDVGADLQQQVIRQSRHFRPVFDIGAEFQLICRLGLAPAVVHSLLIDTGIIFVDGISIYHIQVGRSCQPASVGSCCRYGSCIHQCYRADLPLPRLGAFPVWEVAGSMADREFPVCRCVACPEAWAAEAFTHHRSGRNEIKSSAVLDER